MQRLACLFALASAGCNFAVPSIMSDTQPASDLASAPPGDGADLGSAPAADLSTATPPDLGPYPSLCPLTGAICDGFESGSIGSVWIQHQTHGSLTVDGTRAYRGRYSLHLHDDALAAGMSSDVRLAETATFASSPTDVYVRAFFFVPAAPANAAQMMTALDPMPPYPGVGVNLDSGDLATFDSIGTSSYVRSARALPLGSWTCATWQIHLANDSTGSTHVFLDGSEVTELHIAAATESSNGAGTLSVGFSFFQPNAAQPAVDAWVDEVAIGTAPIACSD